jgi:ribosome-associated protein
VTPEELRERVSESEFIMLTSRSSGPGGQNVNKVSTKVEVRFNFRFSGGLSETEKELILKKLKNRINAIGELTVRSQSERTQSGNRKRAIEKIFILMAEALTENPERKPTVPTKKSQLERIEEKHKRSLTKKLRKDIEEP